MDLETTILLLELQLADTRELLAGGRGRTAEMTDYERALQLQYEELRATLRNFTDLQLSQSMSGAVPDNTPLNVSSSFVRDFEAIPRMSGAMPNDTPLGVSPSVVRDFAQLAISKENTFVEGDADTDNAGEGSSSHVFGQCVACSDRFTAAQGYTAPCNHIYCTGCTIRLFEESLRDESLFPPRCCRQEMVIGSVQTILGAALTQRFNLKAIEHVTPNKTYCHDPRCSRFILPANILGQHGVCTECRAVTCVQCKRGAHNGNCEEAGDAVFQALTQAQGWRGCYRCRAVIELNTGCNHITW